MRTSKKPAKGQASTPASQHGANKRAADDSLKIDTESPPNYEPLESRTKTPATPAATPILEKSKRKTRTSSRGNETTNLQLQPSKKAKTATTASSTLRSSQTTSDTKVQGSAFSTSAVASGPVSRLARAPTAPILTAIVFGSGECGELGLGPKKKAALVGRVNPFLDPNGKDKIKVVQIACGGMHVVALTADNKIMTWGVNDDNALGRDTKWDSGRDTGSDDDDDDDLNPHESTPAQVSVDHFPPDTKFVQVAAGDSCSFALTNTGLVYGWGTFRNSQGDMRFGFDHDGALVRTQDKPRLIPHLKEIMQIVCGANHALALDKSGTVWGWGSGEQNQLGRRPFGRHQDTLTPRRVEVCRGKARYIASGDYHSFAVDAKDNVWGWGLNSFGEAGDAKTAGVNFAVLPYPMKIPELCGRGITTIAGGAHHSAAVTADGECLVWGRLDGGQLGIQFSAQQLRDESLIRQDEHGRPRICLRPTAVPNLGRINHVACGTDHTIFIDEKGHGYATGFGSCGQLGLGSEDDQSVPQRLCGKTMDERNLVWAGAGGQFSIVAHSPVDD
ncbi:regulator of chromosome condensation 1/beta-lactamase-inhibitor protein II [Trichoderma chlorosporum]